jgi:hypothetical protein
LQLLFYEQRNLPAEVVYCLGFRAAVQIYFSGTAMPFPHGNFEPRESLAAASLPDRILLTEQVIACLTVLPNLYPTAAICGSESGGRV